MADRWDNMTEEELEKFIRDNREKFDSYTLDQYHEDHFLMKLAHRFKKFISIVPYLIRVSIATVIIFIVSIWAWDSYIRKDRHEITLKQKVEVIWNKIL
jgi:hypothetical protein